MWVRGPEGRADRACVSPGRPRVDTARLMRITMPACSRLTLKVGAAGADCSYVSDKLREDCAGLLRGTLVAVVLSVPLWGAVIWGLGKIG